MQPPPPPTHPFSLPSFDGKKLSHNMKHQFLAGTVKIMNQYFCFTLKKSKRINIKEKKFFNRNEKMIEYKWFSVYYFRAEFFFIILFVPCSKLWLRNEALQ